VERAEFGNFIDAIEVIDIPMAGKKFTWFNSEGTVMSRLDLFCCLKASLTKGALLTNGLVTGTYQIITQFGLPVQN
jgi:hypothetical protein